ncbi:MAG TPA: hypothetical protein VKR31_03190 [Rhizomicrobium sp.]|nr:hypothetical protein [Rhizomicrobium sp.]
MIALATSLAMLTATPAPAPPVEQVIVTGHRPSADPCHAIAEAKFRQWQQQRFSRVQTETFADGTEKTREKIYTDNTLYIGHGTMWGSLQLFATQRHVESA